VNGEETPQVPRRNVKTASEVVFVPVIERPVEDQAHPRQTNSGAGQVRLGRLTSLSLRAICPSQDDARRDACWSSGARVSGARAETLARRAKRKRRQATSIHASSEMYDGKRHRTRRVDASRRDGRGR
jgi:hypothetical protein